MKDLFKVYPTDIDFHAKISKNIESNPFEKDDSRYFEWEQLFLKYHTETDVSNCCG